MTESAPSSTLRPSHRQALQRLYMIGAAPPRTMAWAAFEPFAKMGAFVGLDETGTARILFHAPSGLRALVVVSALGIALTIGDDPTLRHEDDRLGIIQALESLLSGAPAPKPPIGGGPQLWCRVEAHFHAEVTDGEARETFDRITAHFKEIREKIVHLDAEPRGSFWIPKAAVPLAESVMKIHRAHILHYGIEGV